jgi:hypothetical protein
MLILHCFSKPLVYMAFTTCLYCSIASADVVFQADFKNENPVSYGGWGAVFADAGANATVSIQSSSPLVSGAGDYLSIVDDGVQTSSATTAGINFYPNSEVNSFDSWLEHDGAGTGKDTVNGAFDFYFSLSDMGGSLSGNSLRFLDLHGGSGGLRLVFNLLTADRLSLQLIDYSSGSGVIIAEAKSDSGAFGSIEEAQVYHVAGAASTDSAGKVTLSIFWATGNTEIVTSDTTHRIATATSNSSFDATHAFGSDAGFQFGLMQNTVADSKELSIDQFSVYDSVPSEFGVIAPVDVIFQADFNSGSPVSFGGSGVTFVDSGVNATSSIQSSSPLVSGAGDYLSIVDNGIQSSSGTKAGIEFIPNSAANSFDAWLTHDGLEVGKDSINGAFDFCFSLSDLNGSLAGNSLRFFDLHGGAGGLRLVLNLLTADRMSFQLIDYSSGSGVVIAEAKSSSGDIGTIVEDQLYHVGGTVSTDDATGQVTLSLFWAGGNSEIITSGSAHRIATATSSSDFNVAHAFDSADGFLFGLMQNTVADSKELKIDHLRLYNGVPIRFDSLEFYPDLLDVVAPNPAPVLPSVFDLYQPPVDSSSPSTLAPIIAAHTETAGSGDSLVMTGAAFSNYTGDDEGKDTRFIAFGGNQDAVLVADAGVHRLNGNKVAIGLNDSMPKWGMYLLWPKNANGVGRPVAINQTKAWWLGPNTATRNDTVSLHGTNLSHENGTLSAWLYLNSTSGTGQWLTVTEVNPYKVDFTVPSDLANGTYEIWAHNGHGGDYGWSGPLTLTVDDGMPWTASLFNVQSYGAVGNGVVDDTTAIKNALSAAANSDYSTVYFPAGTYLISSSLNPPSKVRLLGAGKSSTSLVGGASLTDPMIKFLTGTEHIEIRAMTLNKGTVSSGSILNGKLSHAMFIDLNLIAVGSGQSTVYIDPAVRTFFEDCEISGSGMYLLNGEQVFIDSCDLYAMNDLPALNVKYATSELSVTNCTAQDYDNTTTNGWCQGVFVKGLNSQAARRNIYIADNVTTDLGVRPEYYDQNWGEQVAFEQNYGAFMGYPTTASASTVTFASVTDPGVETIAVVLEGAGIGQTRRVESINTSTSVVTVSPDWKVKPDSSSLVALGFYAEQIAIYNNQLDGKTEQVTQTDGTNSNGIQVYGGVFDLVANSNYITDCRQGIGVYGLAQRNATPTHVSPVYFNLFTDNIIVNSRKSIVTVISTADYEDVLPADYLLGVVFRDNLISGSVLSSFDSTVQWWDIDHHPMDMILMENTLVSDTPVGIDLVTWGRPHYIGNMLFVNNTFDLGSAAYTGSMGLETADGQSLYLGGNEWTGFATDYSGTTPGGILELPYRSLEFNGQSGEPVLTESLILWNAGTASMSWSASTDASWLSVAPVFGTVADELSVAELDVSVDELLLSVGTQTGTLTFTSGTQTKKVNVTVVVNQ